MESDSPGLRMMSDLRRLCALGPRPAGSAASAAQLRLLQDHFLACGAAVESSPFLVPHPATGSVVTCHNLIAAYGDPSSPRKLLGAHGDTRPIPDRERDPARRRLPFVGANDGASGVAVLMELARSLGALIHRPPVDLVILDAEELIIDGRGEYCLGSAELAAGHDRVGPARYSGAVIVDMVGRTGSVFRRERYGHERARALTDEVWSIARVVGATSFRDRVGRAIIDDHLRFLDVGIPALVVIDLEDPRWHTADDLPEHCSAESLEQVHRVLQAWVTSDTGPFNHESIG